MTKNEILQIVSFAFNTDSREFKNIFPDDEELADHLYEKWKHDYRDNFLEFYNGGLDDENKEVIANYITIKYGNK